MLGGTRVDQGRWDPGPVAAVSFSFQLLSLFWGHRVGGRPPGQRAEDLGKSLTLSEPQFPDMVNMRAVPSESSLSIPHPAPSPSNPNCVPDSFSVVGTAPDI